MRLEEQAVPRGAEAERQEQVEEGAVAAVCAYAASSRGKL